MIRNKRSSGSAPARIALLMIALVLALITVAALLEFTWSSRVQRQLTRSLNDQGARGELTLHPRQGLLKIRDLSWPLEERNLRFSASSVEVHMDRGELLRKLLISSALPLSRVSLHLREGRILRTSQQEPAPVAGSEYDRSSTAEPLLGELHQARLLLEGSILEPQAMASLLQGTLPAHSLEDFLAEGELEVLRALQLPGEAGELEAEKIRFTLRGTGVTLEWPLPTEKSELLLVHLEGDRGSFQPGRGLHRALDSRWGGLSEVLPRGGVNFSRAEVRARSEEQRVTLEKGYVHADSLRGTLSGSALRTAPSRFEDLQGSLAMEDLDDDLRRLAAPLIFLFTRGRLIPRRGPFTLSFDSRGLSLE
ncbi:hypothetical protein AU468_08080 [Alkalispirochaeta sphaeroplastigenens]|uniref:Uncharacterized protein n=1 Tax=Alkalispirochaeta sphaeroplastigenens TaxID=1187066 RepID=A0A2S4JPV2_9SPIO|nr:hypothetical protein [Alkalispirochaeta sphaeroplastigenens]POR01510.1 hypothetical protein AU468_08080 [Alkalispirochaeta sphaeroplastigenens]